MSIARDIDFYVSVDLGQRRDYTAITVVEEPVYVGNDDWAWELNVDGIGWHSPADMKPQQVQRGRNYEYQRGRPGLPPLNVRHLERLPLGTAYPAVVTHVEKMLRSAALSRHNTVLLLDITGVGRPVYDSFRAASMQPLGILIHGGDSVSQDGPVYRVPKRDLIGAAQVALQTGRIRIASALPHAEALKDELLNFKIEIDPRTAHDSYSAWREGKDHDDLVLSLAQAVWFRERRSKHLDQRRTKKAQVPA